MTGDDPQIQGSPASGRVRLNRRFWLGLLGFLVVAAAGRALWEFGDFAAAPSAGQIETMIGARQFGDAERGALKLTRDDPRDPRAWLLLARARAGAEDFSGAVEALRRVPDWSVRKGEALFFEGQALKKLARGREAERVFENYLDRARQGQQTPLASNARLELMAHYAMQERFDSFRRVFWELFPSLGPADQLETLTMRMRSEFEQTKADLSIEHLGRYVAADPEDAHALAGLAAAYDHAGQLPETLRLYAQAHTLRPDDPEIRARYLDALYRSGDQAGLTQALESGRDLPTNDAIENLTGVAAMARNDSEVAAEAFTRAVALRPDIPEYHHRLSQALLRLGRSEEAAHQAAERTRLIAAREALRKAWNAFAEAYEKSPQSITRELLMALSQACATADWPREAAAWASLSDRTAN